MKYLNQTLFILANLVLAGCSSDPFLRVQTEYVTDQNLASYYVGTPDPKRLNPPLGQRLVIYWSVPSNDCDAHILLRIRYRNKESSSVEIPLPKSSGWITYTLLNEDYMEKGGIETYFAQLIVNGEVLDESRHLLWVERIELHNDDNEESD